MTSGIVLETFPIEKTSFMKNLNKWEIANHIDTSVKETYPSDRDIPATGLRGAKSTSGGEFCTRHSHSPESNSRSDRNFTQSLWGRR